MYVNVEDPKEKIIIIVQCFIKWNHRDFRFAAEGRAKSRVWIWLPLTFSLFGFGIWLSVNWGIISMKQSIVSLLTKRIGSNWLFVQQRRLSGTQRIYLSLAFFFSLRIPLREELQWFWCVVCCTRRTRRNTIIMIIMIIVIRIRPNEKRMGRARFECWMLLSKPTEAYLIVRAQLLIVCVWIVYAMGLCWLDMFVYSK